jgi:hypothetical protein
MRTLEVKPHLGMGDMIFLFSELENMKDRYDRVLVCPPYDMVKTFRGNTDVNFPKQFLQTLFGSDPYYSIVEKSPCENQSPEDIEASYGCKTTFIDLSDKFVKKHVKMPFGSNFIAIHTKVRYISKSEFQNCFTRLVPVLKASGLPIVVFGEQSIPKNPESSNEIFCIYDDLMASVLKPQIHDLTKPTMLDCIDIESLKNDLSIMHNAVCNIAFGVSGIATLVAATAKYVAEYRNDRLKFLDVYYGSISDTRKVVSNNIDVLVRHVQNCIDNNVVVSEPVEPSVSVVEFQDLIDQRIREHVSSICANGKIPEVKEFIETDNFGEVIDKLIIVHIRTWMLEDKIHQEISDTELADLKRKIDQCFKRKRPQLVQALNRLVEKAVVESKSLIEDSVKIYTK